MVKINRGRAPVGTIGDLTLRVPAHAGAGGARAAGRLGRIDARSEVAVVESDGVVAGIGEELGGGLAAERGEEEAGAGGVAAEVELDNIRPGRLEGREATRVATVATARRRVKRRRGALRVPAVDGVSGAANLAWGVAALSDSRQFVEDGLVFSTLNFWGWIAVILGGFQVLGGGLVLARRLGGMIIAIVLAGGGVLVNFMNIGAYPIWSCVAIVCNLLVLWAVTVHGEQRL